MSEFREMHLTPELMAALVRNELPPVVLANLVFNHLLALCPTCRTAVQTSLARLQGDSSFDRAFARSQAALDQRQEEVSKEAQSARRELAEILRTPTDAREGRIQRANARFRSPLLVDLLIEKARVAIRISPDESLHLVNLAVIVAERAATEPMATECRVRASAHQGNAFRVCGDFKAAEASFTHARTLLVRSGVADPLIHAEVARLAGSLHMDRRSFAQAEKLLSQAVLLYRLIRDRKHVAISLMNLAQLHSLQQELSSAIEVNLEALRTLEAENEPQLRNWARHNLASLLCDSGDFAQARKVASQVPVEKETCSTTSVRRFWLEGRVARGLEESDRAESLFKKTINGFRRLALPLYVGLCVLDLAELYLVEGRTSDLMELVGELDPLFSMPELQAEANQALRLFQNAAVQQLLSVQLIQEVRARLERLRHGRVARIC